LAADSKQLNRVQPLVFKIRLTFEMVDVRCILKIDMKTKDTGRRWVEFEIVLTDARIMKLQLTSSDNTRLELYIFIIFSSTCIDPLPFSKTTFKGQIHIFRGESKMNFGRGILLPRCIAQTGLIYGNDKKSQTADHPTCQAPGVQRQDRPWTAAAAAPHHKSNSTPSFFL